LQLNKCENRNNAGKKIWPLLLFVLLSDYNKGITASKTFEMA
jgi:hypothetical protein